MDSFGKDDLDNMLKMIARVNSNFSVPADTVGEASYAFRGDPGNMPSVMTIANVSNASGWDAEPSSAPGCRISRSFRACLDR